LKPCGSNKPNKSLNIQGEYRKRTNERKSSLSHKYLNDKSYYEDLYDKHTIQECRDWQRHVLEDNLPEKAKAWPREDQLRLAAIVIDVPTYSIKGERYLKREETIKRWIQRDQEKDEFVASHPAPTAYCPGCNQKMELMVCELDSNIDDSKLRMIFLYKCKSCNEKKGLYSDGTPYIFKLDFCPKCHKEWEQKYAKTKTKITTFSHCPHCGYKEEDTLDLDQKFEEEIDPDFETDRAKYCMTEKEGHEYQNHKATLPDIRKWQEESDRREKDEKYYEQVKKLKELTIAELSDLLSKELIKTDFKGLTITNTEVKKDLIVSITVQDTRHGRAEWDSRSALKKEINRLLENSNWKLMTEGVSYKLGLLSGRLRGLDNEKELVKMIKKE
jgi:hypothetical protein